MDDDGQQQNDEHGEACEDSNVRDDDVIPGGGDETSTDNWK